ncbi:MAG: GFA family protein [Xanthomonadales bacterium]|nr:GFA family protein [Xanthomonadales bacterium]
MAHESKDSDILLHGGCLCGRLRYALRADEIVGAGYCHCRLCQRSTGAPVVAWLTLPVEFFDYIKGRPTPYLSSRSYMREFCPDCGTQIAFRAVDPEPTLDVTIASLDDPARVPPRKHIWCESQTPWLSMGDDLPRHARGSNGG